MHNRAWLRFTALAATLCSSCGSAPSGPRSQPASAGLSQAADNVMITIAPGQYIAGSTPEERSQAYDDYERTAGHSAARKNRWFEREEDRHVAHLGGYRIDVMPVTQAAYAEFVNATGRAAPHVTRETWTGYGFTQVYDSQVTRFNWIDGAPPTDRLDHPVVLVSWEDARAYCVWRGELVGSPRRLPSAAEFERAARGDKGVVYPWGNDYDPSRLDSAVAGPEDTMAVGSFPSGASPYGMLDAAGNVFQWTMTPWPHQEGRMTVKGSAWDDFGGLGRAAAQHGRDQGIRHAIVGFRCAADG